MSKDDAGEGASSALNSGTTFMVSVLRCKKTGHVLFLETGKDFVDTLISFLLLPVGTILHLLSNVQGRPLGGISSIFESVGNMDSSLLHVDRKYLVEPRPAAIGTCGATGLLQGLEAAKIFSLPEQIVQLIPQTYYRCNHNVCTSLSASFGSICETCPKNRNGGYSHREIAMNALGGEFELLKEHIKKSLREPLEDATVGSTGQGFVRESITYMVTDSLEIVPSTTIRSIKELNKLEVATIADLESNDVSIDITQVLQLLRSALTSSSCLNEVFGKK